MVKEKYLPLCSLVIFIIDNGFSMYIHIKAISEEIMINQYSYIMNQFFLIGEKKTIFVYDVTFINTIFIITISTQSGVG